MRSWGGELGLIFGEPWGKGGVTEGLPCSGGPSRPSSCDGEHGWENLSWGKNGPSTGSIWDKEDILILMLWLGILTLIIF